MDRELKSQCKDKDKMLDNMKKEAKKVHKKNKVLRDQIVAELDRASVQCLGLMVDED